VFSVSGTRAAERPVSEWVHPGADAKLVYKTTPAGDRIMDFSHAGYGGGGIALPDVPVVVTVPASGSGDDTLAIQRAIDRVALLPLKDGFRGTVLLANGTFSCVAPLTISASGIVLRGSGSGARSGPASTIKLTGKPHNAITVRAPGGGRGQAAASDETEAVGVARTVITDAYVPSGAKSFAVKSAAGFSVGDIINIIRPVTAAWVKLMHMDDLTRDGRPQTWLRVGSTITTERRIAAVSENTLTLDVPLSDSFDAHYLNPPGTAVVKVKPPARLTQIGIENLHIESPLQEISHTEPHFTALRVTGEDCWVRDVVIDETMNSVGVGGRRITLERVAVNRKAKHQGASKPAEFAPNASEVLMDRCTVHADNVWFVATGAGVAGPIVVLNCTFSRPRPLRGAISAGRPVCSTTTAAHPMAESKCATGAQCGSGHGWPMGWGVIWNCEARDYIVQDPPGARNWLIGSIGESGTSARPFDSGPKLPGGTEDSPGRAVAPQSLYLAQLAERLGPQALKNIGYASASLDPPNANRGRRRPIRRDRIDRGVGPPVWPRSRAQPARSHQQPAGRPARVRGLAGPGRR